MENEGSVKFFCVACGLQGLLLWDPTKYLGLMCPRCGNKVMTSQFVRDKIPVSVG